MKAFVLDLARCVGCYNCQVACKDEHCGNDWTPYARPQPDTGQFWLKVNYEEKGTIPKSAWHTSLSSVIIAPPLLAWRPARSKARCTGETTDW